MRHSELRYTQCSVKKEMDMKQFQFFLVALLVSLLSSCVSLKVPSGPNDFGHERMEQRQARLLKINTFYARGAFSLVQSGEKPILANYTWQQSGQSAYDIRVFSPLNLFNIQLIGQPDSVKLIRSSKESLQASSPDRLLKKSMGWNLPVRNLYYWIRGASAPGERSFTQDAFGHLAILKQNGWRIEYSHYTKQGAVDLPGKLILTRPNLRLSIVVKAWKA